MNCVLGDISTDFLHRPLAQDCSSLRNFSRMTHFSQWCEKSRDLITPLSKISNINNVAKLAPVQARSVCVCVCLSFSVIIPTVFFNTNNEEKTDFLECTGSVP